MKHLLSLQDNLKCMTMIDCFLHTDNRRLELPVENLNVKATAGAGCRPSLSGRVSTGSRNAGGAVTVSLPVF